MSHKYTDIEAITCFVRPDRISSRPGERSGASRPTLPIKIEPGFGHVKSCIPNCMRSISYCIWTHCCSNSEICWAAVCCINAIWCAVLQSLFQFRVFFVRNTEVSEKVGVFLRRHPLSM